MRSRILYRLSAVLLVLFAAGHQFGFRQVAPEWSADATVAAMKGTHFQVQGFVRDYWSFFSGFGFFVTTFLLFSALLAWTLSNLTGERSAGLAPIRWSFAATYVVIAILTWRYFFMAPDVLAALIAVALVAAAPSDGTPVADAKKP